VGVVPGSYIHLVSFIWASEDYALWCSFPDNNSILMAIKFHPKSPSVSHYLLSLRLTCTSPLMHDPTNGFDSKQGQDDVDGRNRSFSG